MEHRTKQGHVVPRARPADMRAYRFGFNNNLRKWWVAPAEGTSTQMILCDELQTCELGTQSHPDGTFTCLAQLNADGKTYRISDTGGSATCMKITLRLHRSFDQVVHVPVASIVPEAPRPGG